MEALKILKGAAPIAEACRYTYCLREPTRKGLVLQPTPLEKPNQSCFVCNATTVRNSCFKVYLLKCFTYLCCDFVVELIFPEIGMVCFHTDKV